MVNWNNYEEYMLLHTDGELGEAEVKELMDFVKVNPELEEELNGFQAVKLAPEPAMIYPFKEELLKKEQPKTIVLSRSWMYYGAAAGVALLVLVMLPWNRLTDNNTDVAKVEPVSHQTLPAKTATVEPYHKPAVNESVNNIAPNTVATVKNALPPAVLETIEMPVRQIEKTRIQTINSNTGALAFSNPEPAVLSLKELPEPGIQTVALEEETTQEKQEFLAWLPIAEEKKQGLESIKNDLSDRLATAKAVREQLKGSDVVVKLGNRDLFTLNF